MSRGINVTCYKCHVLQMSRGTVKRQWVTADPNTGLNVTGKIVKVVAV